MKKSIPKKEFVFTLALLFLLLSVNPLLMAEVPNGSFENHEENSPLSWEPHTWNGEGEFTHEQTAHTGDYSVAISSQEGGDLSWETNAKVKPFSTYKLSAWIKTEDLQPSSGRGALLNLHNISGVRTESLTGTNDWTQVSTTFETGTHDSVHINCLFGGWGLATGKAWYDEIQLELVSTSELEPAVTIDPSQTQYPISPLIYGQFIEHLGRCIYGGIWAEMLQDRKFYDSVKEDESPWRVVGNAEAVSMDSEDSFVGEHTPKIQASNEKTGIVQKNLALTGLKDYEGRILLKGDSFEGKVEVRLHSGESSDEVEIVSLTDIESEYKKFPLEFTPQQSTEEGFLEILCQGEGTLWIGTLSLMPADNIDGMRRDTLRLLEKLDSPIYRWPGGNFVSGYDWEDGIGNRDRRPPRKNPAWQGIEHNDFGIHEFLRFCEILNTEPLIVVNSGLGELDEAVAELQYVNGDPESPQGKRRAENGHIDPYNVIWWGIGNEMYGDWQLGHMPLEDYVKKHNRFAEAMWEEDPDIQLIAVGAVGEWSETMLRECSETMDMISEHFYCQESDELYAHVMQIPNNVKRIADAHREYRETIPNLKDKNITIALDEWNYWYGDYVYGELGTRYFLKDALGIAAGLHEIGRNSDLYGMANYAQTVNVIGAIKTSQTDAQFATTGLALRMYRDHLGSIPVQLQGDTTPLDVFAALDKSKEILTLAVVNPTEQEWDLQCKIQENSLPQSLQQWIITGDDPGLYNEPGKEERVSIQEEEIMVDQGAIPIQPLSASIIKIPLN